MPSRQAVSYWRLLAAPPETPAGLTVGSPTTSSLAASWDAVSTVVYRLQHSVDQSAWQTVFEGSGGRYVDTGLTASRTYYFRVFAVGASGQVSDPSEVATGVTAGTAAPPAIPAEAPAYSGVQHNQVTLSWGAIAGATNYVLERSPATVTAVWTQVYSGPLLSKTDTALTPSTTYLYRYTPSNADGPAAAASPTVSVTTGAAPVVPATPTAAPTLGQVTASSAVLSWPATAGATSYTLQVSTAPTTGFADVATVTGLSASALGLSAGTTYYFRYRPSSAAGPATGWSPTRTAVTSTTSGSSVRPISALSVRRAAGVRVAPHENGATSEYKGANADAICSRIADMGFSYVRGMFSPTSVALDEWMSALENNHLGWLMTLIPEAQTSPTAQTLKETQEKVETIRDTPRLAALAIALEGLNEPNHNRGGGTVPLDWASTAYSHQVRIWETARPSSGTSALATLPILGPSLHDVYADNSYSTTLLSPEGGPRHFHQLLDLGVLNCQTHAGMHCYPSGRVPLTGLPERLSRMRDAYGSNYPVWVTEWGYSNNTGGGGGNPVTPEVAGVYGPRGVLQFIVDEGIPMAVYEFADNYDPGLKDEREKNFGIISTDSTSTATSVDPRTWAYKPIATEIKALLKPMVEPAGTPDYAPAAVVFDLTTTASGVKSWLTATKAQSDAGTATAHICKDGAYTLAASRMTIKDRVGDRTFDVGPSLVHVDLR